MRTIFFACLLLFYSLSPATGSQLVLSAHRAELIAAIHPGFFATDQFLHLLSHRSEITLPSLLLNAAVDVQSTSNETGAPLLNYNKASDDLKNDLNSLKSQRNIFVTALVGLLLILFVVIYFYRKTIHLNKIMMLHQNHLEELNSMKDKLLSVIGHDLRGPIARIPAIIDIYEDPNTTDDEKQFILDNLKEQTRASLETFDKLLYWGQTLVKGISLHQIEMKPKGYIKEGIDLRRIKATEKNITITDHTPAELVVFSDPSLFDFIVRNLLANALKYTFQNGTIDIYADATRLKGFTVFSVKDSGVGIDKENIPKLFYSLKSQQGTDNEKGHGIGLMLCKEFAVQNGGDIWVESEKGKGATFYFSVKSHP